MSRLVRSLALTFALLAASMLQACAPPPEQGATPMRIIVVHWKIRPGREADFLKYWGTRSVVADRSGLVSEYLSSVETKERAPWANLRSLDPAHVSYFNVGIWRDVDAFQDQIGKYIDNTRPPLDFEAAPRERVMLAPELWRVGRSAPPGRDPRGVQ